MLRRAVILAGLIWALAAGPAAADSVTRDAFGVITVDARTVGGLQISRSGANIGFSGAFTTGGVCTGDAFGVLCPLAGTTRIDVTSSPADDFLFVTGDVPVLLTWDAGAGNDGSNALPSPSTGRMELHGGEGRDTLVGGAAADLIDGGPGSDGTLAFGNGDEIVGGPGSDTLRNPNVVNDPMFVSLDDVVNDGYASNRTGNVHSDVEEVILDQFSDVYTGSPGSDTVRGGRQNDSIDALGGFDSVDGEDGNDTITSRDGLAERVDCGAGNDTAIVDDVDVPIGCESVSVSDQVRPDVDGDGARKPGDCNDNDPAIRPGAPEVLENGVDEDCDGADAQVLDRDGDGVPRPLDCDDTTGAVRPGAKEVLGNKIDENCNGRAEPFPTLGVTLRQRTLAFAAFTTVDQLRLGGLRRGQRIRIACKGGGCPFARRTIRVRKGGRRELAPRLDGARLRGGAKLTIRVTARNGVAKQFAFTFRKGAAPIFLVRCAAPGAGLRRC